MMTDLRKVFAEDCIQIALTMIKVPVYCDKYLTGQGIHIHHENTLEQSKMHLIF